MIKSIIQYLNDVRHTIDLSDRDDVIWIYVPMAVLAGTIVLGLSLIINTVL